MIRFSRKKGAALADYVLIAAIFAVAMGFIAVQMNPDLLKTYFERTIDDDTTTAGDGTLTLPVMGE